MRIVNLKSRRGVEFGALVMVMLPLVTIVFSVAIDGLAYAATARRAQGVAAVAAQAGATRISFAGGRPSIAGDACAVATANARTNSAQSFGPTVTCTTGGNTVRVSVGMNVPRLFGFYTAIPGRVTMTMAAEPQWGIQGRE